jgi:hypothetical protein
MKKYQLQKQNEDKVLGTFDSKQEAANEMEEIIENNNDELDEDDSDWLTPFDFTLKEIEVKEEINELVDSYEAATHYLGYKADVKTKINGVNPKHIKALIALNALFTIADAWNKADDFVPDFSNRNQYKYFPWFQYNDSTAGFVFAFTNNTATFAYANFGSRLCFKTSERAHQFGNQFINLWNDVLLFR